MRRFLTKHWLGMHALVLLAVAVFLTLGWWQAIRAGDGNARSYGYAAEWPTFAIIVVFLWIRAMRLEVRAPSTSDVAETTPSRYADEIAARAEAPQPDDDDPELAAYNSYLAGLSQQDTAPQR